jgi:LCP family protein required for cell wall assembly
MADGDDEGEAYERFLRPRDPSPRQPPDRPGPRPASYPAPAPPGPRPPRRRVAQLSAQQRLMARIAASKKARQQRALLVASGLMSAIVLFVAGGAWALTGYISGAIGRVDAGTAGTPPSGPLNILVAGVDTRSGLSPHEQAELHVGHVAGANSDVMMVVHLSADHRRVTVVSLPRDTWLNIPGHGMNKINAAYGLGGPKLVVQTVEQATGLTINDYVGVNFLAVVKVVDSLGGVNVCLPQAVNDPYTGLDLPAGKSHVNGITALKYARDRHSFAAGDLTRIGNQQKMLASLLKEAISGGTLANPVRFTQFLNASLAALQVDRGLNAPALANQMRGISTSDVSFTTVPLASANYQAPNGASAVLWDAQAAKKLFTGMADDTPSVKPKKASPRPSAAPSVAQSAKAPGLSRGQVTVDVYNGTLIGGLSASTGAQLSQLGFQVNAGLTWPKHDVTQTMIQYPQAQLAAARLLHTQLPAATMVQKPGLSRPRIILGTDGSQLAAAGQSGSGSGSSGSAGSGSATQSPAKAKTATQNACG